jgi:hypothetical protein
MRPLRLLSPALAAAALALSACATMPYTGPVEVIRFVGADREGLGQGSIALQFPDAMSNEAARSAFAAAVGAELARLGYQVTEAPGPGTQSAVIRTTRTPIAAAEEQRGPVNVGVGGQAGSFGSGVGMGVGVNLGGGREGPAASTELSVRINRPDGTSMWEGRAQMTTGVKSPYAQVETSARTLAAALFRDFPGGNGQTVSIDVKKLQGTP